MNISQTSEKNRQNMNQFFVKVTVQNILTCFLVMCMVLGLAITGAYAETQVSGDITENTTWTLSGSPYLVTADLTIHEGVTLTINAGVAVKVKYRQIHVKGTLIADGNASQKIYFTSWKDDEAGGDTNGDGSASSPSRGDWTCLHFYSTSTDNNVLDNVEIRYGGDDYRDTPMVSIYSSSLTLSNSIIQKSEYRGLHIGGDLISITECEIKDNHDYGIYVQSSDVEIKNSIIQDNSKGIYLGSSSAAITGNTISNNRNAVTAWSSVAAITGNTITDNDGYAIFLDRDFFRNTVSGNTIRGNGINDLCYGGTITESVTLDIPGSESPYVVLNNWQVSDGATLTINPGVVIKFSGYDDGISVYGTLKADGTPEQPIYFTSLKDDEAGGDTNGDGGDSTPSHGNWDELYFRSSSSDNVLDNVVIRYGKGVNGSSSLTVTHSTIEKNFGDGISGTSSVITGNIIRDNSGNGIEFHNSDATLTDNTIMNNGSGIEVRY